MQQTTQEQKNILSYENKYKRISKQILKNLKFTFLICYIYKMSNVLNL